MTIRTLTLTLTTKEAPMAGHQTRQFWMRYRAGLIQQWRAAAAAEPGQLPEEFAEMHLALIRAVEEHASLPRFEPGVLTAAHRRGARPGVGGVG